MFFRKQGSLFIPTRNILVPRNWTLRDNRGFISPGVIGGIAGARRRGAAGGYTLLYDSIAGGTSTVNFGAANTAYYSGQSLFNDSSRTIGKITLLLTSVGTITSKTLRVRFWTQNASEELVSNVATSDGVTGASWSAQEVDFIFSTPFTTTGSTNYAITVDMGGADASNYGRLHYVATASAPIVPPGKLAFGWWNIGQYATFYTSFEFQAKIYTTP